MFRTNKYITKIGEIEQLLKIQIISILNLSIRKLEYWEYYSR